MALPPRIAILNVPIDPYTMTQTVSATYDFIKQGHFAHLIGVNADKILQIRSDPHLQAIVSGCEIINADGASMLIASKLLSIPIPERVAGIDLMMELCELAAKKSLSIYLLGATNKVVAQTESAIKRQFPSIQISGRRDGYFSETEFESVTEELKQVDPDIIFVGITSPKKEMLIEHFRQNRLKGAFVGVGGSFDVISGNIRRAPQWIQRLRMEWFFRMVQEPRRLGKRYLVGNSAFLTLLVRERISSGRRHRP